MEYQLEDKLKCIVSSLKDHMNFTNVPELKHKIIFLLGQITVLLKNIKFYRTKLERNKNILNMMSSHYMGTKERIDCLKNRRLNPDENATLYQQIEEEQSIDEEILCLDESLVKDNSYMDAIKYNIQIYELYMAKSSRRLESAQSEYDIVYKEIYENTQTILV